MKRIVLLALTALLSVTAALMTGCVREELPDNRETEYGYVQFKLYKEASYETKAVVSQLDSLSQAEKIAVSLLDSDGMTITQTLTLTASDAAAADYGLRSDKLRLLAGEYQIVNYVLYDNLDEELYREAVGTYFTVIAGGLNVFDLTANVAERGTVRFNLVKDMSGLSGPTLNAVTYREEYTFDEITSVTVVLENMVNVGRYLTYENLPVVFEEYFRDEEHYDGNDDVHGYQTSSSYADTEVYVPAGQYKIRSYSVFDSDGNLLETQDYSSDSEGQVTDIVVEDNTLTEVDIPVTLVEADEYIQDNYALYLLWKSLNGPEWSYEGQSWARGANWDFDKDIDLWCDQPGVQVHPNGRIASIDLSGFGISGEVPAAIGQFTELVQLSLGDHNETNVYLSQYNYDIDVTGLYPVTGSSEEKAAWVENKYRHFASNAHPAQQVSPVCALALKLNGKSSVATTVYDDMTIEEIARMASQNHTVSDYQIRPYDMNSGVLTNGLTKIHSNIGNLTKLESLSIANSPITADGFPAEMASLDAVTELEIYNCPNLESFPEGVAGMGALITVNISNVGFDDGTAALAALASGDSEDVIQVLYFLQNNVTSLPEAVGNMGRLGMLDLASNNISGALPALGSNFAPTELVFDYNSITSVPENFCSLDALDSFSISYNELEEFPNMFDAGNDVIMTSIDVSYNNITSLPTSGFNGLRAVTLTLSGNPIKTFPKELGETNSYVETLVMQQCGLEEFPEGCFNGEYSYYLSTMDLQYNNLTDLPDDFIATKLPYLYGLDLTNNSFSSFPYEPLNILRLTAFSIRGQRDASGSRCLREWPTGLYSHTGLRAFYIGSNDLRVIDDTISYMIYYLDISDNPNIVFDASDICSYWEAGYYILYYDKTQEILNCDSMLE